jgi:adenylate cyclase
MEERARPAIRIDLSQFKLHIRLKPKTDLTLHFDSPSRRFYLSVIALVVNEMKRMGQVTSIPLEAHADELILLNETVGGCKGSSEKESLIPRIYRKWKDALPHLENAPLFKVMGHRKEQEDGPSRTYHFSEAEKDLWANLFEYKGSEEHVRLRFSIDTLGVALDDAVIVYEDARNGDAWDRFIASLKAAIPTRDVPSATLSPVKKEGRVLRLSGALLIALLAVVVGTASLTLWHIYGSNANRASIQRTAFPLPDKPSIAVLPFVNMSDDPKQEFLADGLTEEIINALSRLSSVTVIARNSSFTYKGRHVKIQQVAEEMVVRYVLEGSVRKVGDKVRITAQLVDTLTGNQLMSEQYESDLKDVFAIQDEVTMKVLTSLRVNLTDGESARTFARGTKNLEAYLKIVQAYELRVIWNKESQIRAHRLAEEALALDPGYALAYSILALVLSNEVQLGVYDNPQNVRERAYRLAEKAVALDDSSAWSHLALGLLSVTFKKDWDKATAEIQRAIDLEPGSAYGYGYLGSILIYAGRYEDAITYYKKAFRLSPRPMPIFLMNLASGHTAVGQYDEAIKLLKTMVDKEPDQTRAHVGLAEAYVLSGKKDYARKEAAEVLRVDPTFSVESFYRNQPYKDTAEINRRIEALHQAGLK